MTSSSSTLLGPSPFDRSHSMAVGFRASLPKLPSFRRRAPEPKEDINKKEDISKVLSEKSTSVTFSKKRRINDSETEQDTETLHEGKRPRTTSSLLDDDDDRSQSPWQHLDDNLEAAPPAMDVRVTQGRIID